MKSKLVFLLIISSLTLFSFTKVRAINSPPVLVTPPDDGSPPAKIPVAPPAPIPQPIPVRQPNPDINPSTITSSPVSRPQINNTNPVGLNNHNISGNTNNPDYLMLVSLGFLWFSIAGLLGILLFIFALYKRKQEGVKIIVNNFNKLPPY